MGYKWTEVNKKQKKKNRPLPCVENKQTKPKNNLPVNEEII